jgi:hypothetical protein
VHLNRKAEKPRRWRCIRHRVGGSKCHGRDCAGRAGMLDSMSYRLEFHPWQTLGPIGRAESARL